MDHKDITAIRDKILTEALVHVDFDGWHWEVFENAARECGHRKQELQAVFPARLDDALDHFADMADRRMLESLKDTDPESLRVRDRVTEALMARFEYLQPHKEAFRQSVSYWLRPFRKARGAKIVWRTADRIWDWAGDTATDYNRYTKRGLLSGVIVSTSLAWLNDQNDNMSTTKAFLDRRIENVMQLNKVMRKVKKKSHA